jgi:hypothetical protein
MEPAEPTPEYLWYPLTIDEAQRLFDPLRIPWWIAGGWAVDVHLQRQTREHADVDVSILRRDHRKLRTLLDEFDIRVAHDGALLPCAGDELAPEYHQFWARRRGDEAWAFEVLLEDHAGAQWLYRRDHRIKLPLERFGTRDVKGVPYVAPEVALLYKSNRHDLGRNAADFASAVSALTTDARAWLRDALSLVQPGHPWIEDLSRPA